MARLSLPLEGRRRRWSWPTAAAILLVVLCGGWLLYVGRKYPTASPLTSTASLVRHIGHPHARMQRQVIGFLPFWQVDQFQNVQTNLLSEVVFFALTTDENGQIVKQTKGHQEPGWRAWRSPAVRDQIAETQIAGGKYALSVALQDGVKLGAFLDNPGAQQDLVTTVASEVASNRLDGLNLDFEFSGASTPIHRQVFTDFGRALVTAVHARSPGAEVSIDLPPTSARKLGLYDVPSLGHIFDRVIVMSYDYYAAGSDVAGPVAPMSGYQDGRYFFDVMTTYDDFAGSVPRDKLIVGVPYYGYDWPVEDNSKPLAPTLSQDDTNGYAEIVSYSRMKTNANLSGQNCRWDDTAQETWCAYTDPNTKTPREAWLADDRSIGGMFDFAKQRGLQGVAIWTLGYGGTYTDPWRMLQQDFTAP